MAASIEEGVLNALRGHMSHSVKLPAPLIVKIYVACTKRGEISTITNLLDIRTTYH